MVGTSQETCAKRGPPEILRPITIPSITNAIVSNTPGIYYAPSRGNFSFTIQPTGANAGKIPVITTGRTSIPDSEGVVVEDRGNGIYKVTILAIQEPINMSIDFDSPTGNESIDEGTSVWTSDGRLYITAIVSGNATIYNATGALIKTVAVVAGETVKTVNTPLPAGFYVVSINGKTYKVVSK